MSEATGAQLDLMGNAPSEITDPSHSGGPNTSHTIMVGQLEALLSAVPGEVEHSSYESAVIEDNVLGKDTLAARRRTFRYLRELYLLRPDSVLFSALRVLWDEDPRARPLLACLCAVARDPAFRASAPAILDAAPGDHLTSHDLAATVERQFPAVYNSPTLAKIGRNTFSSWEQSGHLRAVKRTEKVRSDADCRPVAVAYALMVGMVDGFQGISLLESFWIQLLDRSRGTIVDQAQSAARLGLIDFKAMGGVVEVGTDMLQTQTGGTG